MLNLKKEKFTHFVKSELRTLRSCVDLIPLLFQLLVMGTNQQFSLRWNNYVNHITQMFDTLREDENLVDVTLCCEGKKLRAHKMLLSACSSYFREIFQVTNLNIIR